MGDVAQTSAVLDCKNSTALFGSKTTLCREFSIFRKILAALVNNNKHLDVQDDVKITSHQVTLSIRIGGALVVPLQALYSEIAYAFIFRMSLAFLAFLYTKRNVSLLFHDSFDKISLWM